MEDKKATFITKCSGEFHQKVKLHVLLKNTTIQEFTLDAIKEKLIRDQKQS